MMFKDENEKNQYEYEKLFAYDLELTKYRWTVFAALFSISLIILGLVFGGEVQSSESWAKYAKYTVAFGFLVYLTATYHYFWHHRISHRIRDRLKEIEKSERFDVMTTVHKKPRGLYFHWAIWILGLAYAILTFLVLGKDFFLYYICGLIISVIILALLYKFKEICKKFIKKYRKKKEEKKGKK